MKISARRLLVCLDLIVLIGILIGFVVLTWGRWAHPIVDFGREVYVPWRLCEGEILYRDIAYLFGPLPPYWNAFLFKIFGVSLQTLRFADVGLTCAITVLIYRLFYLCLGRFEAFFLTLCFISLFATSFGMGWNMYYLAPYSHNPLFAIFFGFIALNLLQSYGQKSSEAKLFTLGAVLGLQCLSRIEIFCLFVIGILVGFLIQAKNRGSSAKDSAFKISLLCLGILIPVTAAFLYFFVVLKSVDALLYILGYQKNWVNLSQVYIYTKQYVQWKLNLVLGSFSFLWCAYLCAIVYLASRELANIKQMKNPGFNIAWIFFLAVLFGCLGFTIGTEFIYHVPRSQSIFAVIAGSYFFRRMKKAANDAERNSSWVMLTLCVIALLMMVKTPLLAWLYGYALLYNLPGCLLLGVCLMTIFAGRMEKLFSAGRFVRTLAAVIIIVMGVNVMSRSYGKLMLRKTRISNGVETMYSLGKENRWGPGESVNKFIAWTKSQLGPNDTFVCLPEGVMLNYLTRHKVSGRDITYMPAEIAVFGEESMLADLKQRAPDYFVLIHTNAFPYGMDNFSEDYLPMIKNWVISNYNHVWTSSKVFDNRFSILVMKKNGDKTNSRNLK